MKNLILPKDRHMLWHDEVKPFSDFIILKYGEVYKFSDSIVRVFCWSDKILAQLKKMGLILSEIKTDDNFYTLDIKIENLPLLIQMGRFKKRLNSNSKWFKEKEILLGHKIRTYFAVNVGG